MQHLAIVMKWMFRGSLMMFLFSGLIACKETDGFVASKTGIAGFTNAQPGAQPQLLELTEEATQGIQDRLQALANLEENIELKDERIKQLEDQLAESESELDAKITANQAAILAIESENGVVTPSDVLRMNQESAELRAHVDQLTEERLSNVENYKSEFETMIASFSELVTELSKYESTEELENFKTLILEKLEVLEADRELVLARISEKDASIAELKAQIELLEASSSPDAITELNDLREELNTEQSRLAEDAAVAGALSGLIETSTEALTPSVAPVAPPVASSDEEVVTGEALDRPETPVEGEIPTIKNQLTPSAQAMQITQQINELKAQNVSLKDLVSQIDEQVYNINAQLVSTNTTELQVEKNGLLTQKSEALAEIIANEVKIAPLQVTLLRLQRIIVSL